MKYVALICICLGLAFPGYADDAGRITVSGEGRSSEAPDIATITVGVSHEDKTATGALAIVSERTGAFLDQMEAMGIEERDLQTSQLSLNPQWTYIKKGGRERNEVTGYVASNLVTAKIRDLDSLGSVLDKVVASGANTFRGLNFGFADPTPLKDVARELAVKDAMRKAQLLTKAANVELGRLVTISEAGNFQPPMPMARASMEAMSDAVPIAQGELTLTARVTLVYEIEE
ncbi:MAG: SIMPL domain-containing protein [Litoreibacter sp.]|nr:SIMPL domain-containing protein [Litoreibacter sp.]